MQSPDGTFLLLSFGDKYRIPLDKLHVYSRGTILSTAIFERKKPFTTSINFMDFT